MTNRMEGRRTFQKVWIGKGEKDRNTTGGVFGERTKKGGRESICDTNEYFKIRRREMK